MNRSEYAKRYGLTKFAAKYPRAVIILGYLMLAFFPIIWLISSWEEMIKDFKYVKNKDLKAMKEYIKLDK